MGSSGTVAYRNYALFHFRALRPLFRMFWNRTKKNRPVEGVSAEFARQIKAKVGIPVISTGGYQDARLIRHVIGERWVDAVSIARPLIANPDLPKVIASGRDLPERPCTFCNRCLINAVYNPLACYDLRRFDGDYAEMIRCAMEVFDPPGVYITDIPVPRAKPKNLYVLPPYEIPLGDGEDRIKVGTPILPGGSSALVDQVRENSVDVVQLRFRRYLVTIAVAVAVAVGVVILASN